MASPYVEGTRARATAARTIITGLKDARDKAVRELSALERQQKSATDGVRNVLEKLEGDFEPQDGMSAEEERQLERFREAYDDALSQIDEMSTIVGDFAYELDIAEALKSAEDRIKNTLRTLDRAVRVAAKAGITL